MPAPVANHAGQGIGILHIALNPVTGPWSVMRDLALAQAESGRYAGVGIAVIHPRDWPERYATELNESGLRFYRSKTVQVFGTAQFLWQRVVPPPLGLWIRKFSESSGVERCVTHFHNAWMSGVFLPLRNASRHRPAVVATFHGMNAQLEGRPIRRFLHRWMAARLPRHGARLTSVDQANLPLIRSVLGLDPGLFTVIPNGVAERVDCRCAPWDGTGTFRVGHLGMILSRKGWRLAAEAVLHLRGQGLDIQMLIAGAGPDEPEARELARVHPEAIEFLGHVPDPRRNLLPRLHALALMSEHEGLPMSLIEGMAAGLPVVATAVGGIPEALEHERTGFLVGRDVASLAAALRRLHESPGLWKRLSDQALEDFSQRFEIRQIVDRYDRVYREAVQS